MSGHMDGSAAGGKARPKPDASFDGVDRVSMDFISVTYSISPAGPVAVSPGPRTLPGWQNDIGFSPFRQLQRDGRRESFKFELWQISAHNSKVVV